MQRNCCKNLEKGMITFTISWLSFSTNCNRIKNLTFKLNSSRKTPFQSDNLVKGNPHNSCSLSFSPYCKFLFQVSLAMSLFFPQRECEIKAGILFFCVNPIGIACYKHYFLKWLSTMSLQLEVCLFDNN